MSIINKEYFTNFCEEEILSGNVIRCSDISGQPSFLIRNSTGEIGINKFGSDYLELKTNWPITLNDKEIGSFHILSCKTKSENVLMSFNRAALFMFNNLNHPMSSEDMILLFQAFITLFKVSPGLTDVSLQTGIYGELVTINKLFNDGYGFVANKWHKNLYNKHDIEIDSSNRIEIKSTSTERRIHRFSHDQIFRNDVHVFVISLLLEKSDEGKSLYTLIKETQLIVSDPKVFFMLEKIIFIFDLNESTPGIVVNYEHALLNLRCYDSHLLPHLTNTEVQGITGISYDVDCQLAEPGSFLLFERWR